MKRIPLFPQLAHALAFCTLIVTPVLAQTPDLVVNTFDSADEAAQWSRWWGAAVQTYEFDPTMDASNNAASGSLKATVEFDRTTHGGDNQFAMVGGFADNAVVDGTQYTNLVFDLRWDPNSPKRVEGDFGFLEIGFRKSDFSQLWLTPLTVPATAADGWMKVTLPISPGAAGVDRLTGVVFKLWSGDPNTGFIGNTVFWIDNVTLEGREDTTVPAPTLFLEEADPGLRIYASGSGQYQRQNIRSVETTHSWVGAASPVTYSFNIADYPDAAHPGFQTHLFLVPGSGLPNWEAGPDWSQPNIIFLDIQNTAEGTANATFRHKTNSPNGNTMIYNSNPENGPAGSIASISSETILGTWSLTFSNDTSITLAAPNGASTNFTISAETAALFADPLYIYLGVQPNRTENLGQSALFTNFRSTGTASPITETFAGVVPETDPEAAPNLDPAIWERVAENAAGVVLIPTNTTYVAEWTVPAVGFKLQHANSLTNPDWTDVTATATQIGDRVRAPLAVTGNQGFYRLIKP